MARSYNVCYNTDNGSVVDFLNENLTKSSGSLNICHLNARSVPSHIDELSNLLSSTDLHIVGISETWLRAGVPNCAFQIPGFLLIRNDRQDDIASRGGGVGLYLRDNFRVNIIHKSCMAVYDALFVELKLCGAKLLIGVVYVPRTPTIALINEIAELISTLAQEYQHIIIMGDFNVNLNNSSSVSKHFVDSMSSLSIEILPFCHTRLASTLDLIMIASTNSEFITGLGQTPIGGISDHDLVFMNYRYRYPPSKHKYLYVRDFRSLDENLFLNDCMLQNWSDIYLFPDINSKIECFNVIFAKLLNRHVPMKRKLCVNESVPWFNSFIIKLINQRDSALLAWRRNKTSVGWSVYTKLRNSTSRLIRDCKRRYFHSRLSSDNSRTNIWRVINNLRMRPTNNQPLNFTADEFNRYFCSVPQNSIVLPMAQGNIYSRNELNFIAFSEIEVAIACMQIKSNAAGHDGVVPKLIKIILPVILPYCTHILNFIITTCSFPDSWRKAIVIPVPKVSSPLTISDFRPISILPYLSKVFEILVSQQIVKYLNEFKLWDPLQSGFRKNHSTTTALGKVYFDLLHSMNQSHFSLLVLLDFSKAFDCINHTLLAQKLRLYFQFSELTTRLIVSYLSNRCQVVKSGNVLSTPLFIPSGVPQGSVLGPLLFSLYINDLPRQLLYSNYHIYADDFQLYISGPLINLHDICHNLNVDLLMVSSWAKSNGLLLNAKKSQVLPVYKRKIDLNIPPIIVSNQNLVVSEVVKNLGVLFNSTLTWNDHISQICKKVNFSLYSLRKLSDLTPTRTKMFLVKSLIVPLFTYGDIFVFNSDYHSMHRLRLTFNSCIRYIHGLRKFDHVSAYQESILGVPLSTYLEYRVLCFIFKLLHIKHPSYLYSLLTFSSSPRVFRITSFSSRFSTKQFSSSIFVHGIALFNSLPDKMKRCTCIKQFKKACFEFVKRH